MSAEMSPRERVLTALRGDAVDRPPVSLWRHFPERDQTARQLATSTLDWQALLQLDFIKLMPPGDYPTIDWGAASEYRGAPGGTRQTTRFPVTRAEDWSSIHRVRVDSGFNAEVVLACSLVRERLTADIPLLQTVFSPLTIAHKLSNGAVIDHLRTHPDLVHTALAAVRDVTVAMTRASLAAGASGVFFASQCATPRMVTREEYTEFGTAYDLPVVAAANEAGSEFTLTHIHGEDAYFDVLVGYDAHAVNWHDRRYGPSIATVRSTYPDRAMVGGIDEQGIATFGAVAVREQVLDARGAAADRHLLIGPGCVIPVATPEANLMAAVAAARE
jgi:uroporphyrinogen decarboxylase